MMVVVVALLASAPEGSVVVSDADCSPALMETVRSEFVAAGFGLDDAGARLATIALRCDAEQVVASVDDHVTHKRVERTFATPLGDSRSTARLAVLVVELLHASLAEARFAPNAPVPAPVERFLAEREPARWRAELGAGALLAPARFGVEPSVAGALWNRQRLLSSWLELGVIVDATVRATRLGDSTNGAEVGLVALRAAAGPAFELPGLTIQPRVGVGALLVWAVGHADIAHVASTGVAPTFTASLGVSGSWSVSSWLAVGLSADVGVAPFPVAVVLPTVTTTVGLPWASFTLFASFR
jgi:hypothetical protein